MIAAKPNSATAPSNRSSSPRATMKSRQSERRVQQQPVELLAGRCALGELPDPGRVFPFELVFEVVQQVTVTLIHHGSVFPTGWRRADGAPLVTWEAVCRRLIDCRGWSACWLRRRGAGRRVGSCSGTVTTGQVAWLMQ